MLEEFFTPRLVAALDLEPKRYVDEIFTSVNVETNVVYGANIGIITQAPALEDLTMDVYTPDGDDVTNRPVIVLLHTGTFLPAIVMVKQLVISLTILLLNFVLDLLRKVM